MKLFTHFKHPITLIGLCAVTLSNAAIAGNGVKAAPNGIELPKDYKDWRVISVSHRTDHKSMRVILGNDTAIKAARAGKTNPWPNGTILGKVVWKETKEKDWETAIAPDKFIHAEFMYKDTVKYKANDGWGYARWVGEDQKPYGASKDFDQECIACHTPVKDRDWVFTTPAVFP